MKRALITGITGQDGAYLAQFLLEQGYEVHGIQRRSSLLNTARIDSLAPERLHLHHGDLTETASLLRILERVRPDEVYNLAAQSHVPVSFEEPEYTANSDGLGVLRLLEAMRMVGLAGSARFYQASTSELYGAVRESPQTEATPFHPRSPYGVAKLYGFWITVNYRESYGMFASNGILFNHESPLRGETFVTRKITRGLARIRLGLDGTLRMGNLHARRDWGHARDSVRAMWLMLQHTVPDDFVIATGEQHSVRDFITAAAREMDLHLQWRGEGLAEEGVDQHGRVIVAVDPAFFRPAEVHALLGDSSKARRLLRWQPEIGFDALVREMVAADLKLASLDQRLLAEGVSGALSIAPGRWPRGVAGQPGGEA